MKVRHDLKNGRQRLKRKTDLVKRNRNFKEGIIKREHK